MRKTQHERILDILLLGHEIDLTMCPFTTKLSTRLNELQQQYPKMKIERGWKSVGRFVHKIRTYKLINYAQFK